MESLLKIVQEKYNKEIKKNKLSKEAKIYKEWGTVVRNIELMDLSREEFRNSDVVNLKCEIEKFDYKVNINLFKFLCQEFNFNSILRDFNFWIASFNKTTE